MAFMKIIRRVKKGFVKLSSNDTYFSYIWLSRVLKYEEVITEGVYYCGQLKTSHKGSCLSAFKKNMKKWTGGLILL